MIRGSSFRCIYHDQCTKASVHAHLILVCLGLYLCYLLMELAQTFRLLSGIIQLIFVNTSWSKRTSQCAYTLHSCMLRPISWLPIDGTCSNFQIMIRGSFSSFWCTYRDPSTQASVHTGFILVFLGLYLGYMLKELALTFRLWSGDHKAHFGVHIMTQAHKPVCMHASFLHAWAYILAESGQMR